VQFFILWLSRFTLNHLAKMGAIHRLGDGYINYNNISSQYLYFSFFNQTFYTTSKYPRQNLRLAIMSLNSDQVEALLLHNEGNFLSKSQLLLMHSYNSYWHPHSTRWNPQRSSPTCEMGQRTRRRSIRTCQKTCSNQHFSACTSGQAWREPGHDDDFFESRWCHEIVDCWEISLWGREDRWWRQ